MCSLRYETRVQILSDNYLYFLNTLCLLMFGWIIYNDFNVTITETSTKKKRIYVPEIGPLYSNETFNYVYTEQQQQYYLQFSRRRCIFQSTKHRGPGDTRDLIVIVRENEVGKTIPRRDFAFLYTRIPSRKAWIHFFFFFFFFFFLIKNWTNWAFQSGWTSSYTSVAIFHLLKQCQYSDKNSKVCNWKVIDHMEI